MLKIFSDWLDRRIVRRSTITSALWSDAFAALPILDRLTEDEKRTLRDLAVLFLHHKVFEGGQGMVVTLPMALTISLQACLPVLKLGLGVYAGWSAVIVYPSGFAPQRDFTDENGVVHQGQINLSGESWQRGPVILAWDETARAGVVDGHNLVIHEFAHKLDMQNGVANGFPPLHTDMDPTAWLEAFSAGFEDFQAACSLGRATGIDCYGASSPAEFFAVLSEVFFERPDVLQQHYAAIYTQLRQYYRQDPLLGMDIKRR